MEGKNATDLHHQGGNRARQPKHLVYPGGILQWMAFDQHGIGPGDAIPGSIRVAQRPSSGYPYWRARLG